MNGNGNELCVEWPLPNQLPLLLSASSSKKEDKEEEEEKTHGGVRRAGIVHMCSNPQDSDGTSVVPDPFPSPQAQNRGVISATCRSEPATVTAQILAVRSISTAPHKGPVPL